MKNYNCAAIGRMNRRLIYDYLKDNRGWFSAKTLSLEFGLPSASIHIHCRNLIRFGLVIETKIEIHTHQSLPPRDVIHYAFKHR
jgi:hypothetical protein